MSLERKAAGCGAGGAAARPVQGYDMSLGLVVECIASILMYPRPDLVPVDSSFKDIGFDSLSGVDLCNHGPGVVPV